MVEQQEVSPEPAEVKIPLLVKPEHVYKIRASLSLVREDSDGIGQVIYDDSHETTFRSLAKVMFSKEWGMLMIKACFDVLKERFYKRCPILVTQEAVDEKESLSTSEESPVA